MADGVQVPIGIEQYDMPDASDLAANVQELHPAQRVLVGKTVGQMEELIRKGVGSAYPLNNDDFHLRPSDIRGRTGDTRPGHFTGYINTETGKLRVDHTGDLAFWLEVDISELVAGFFAHK